MHSQPQAPQPDPRVGPDYETILNAAPEDALTLGVDGHDMRANAQRAQIAARLDVEFQRREQRAWADARRPQAPDLLMPFGAGLVADAAGDLRHVLDTHEPELIRQVLHRQGKYRQYVDVEGDGSIRDRVPSAEERRVAEREVARVRAVLAERGALGPERQSAERAAVTTQPACRAYHPPGADPYQSPGSVSDEPWAYPQYGHADEAHDDAEIDPPF
ncbi:hypothetical protein GCM10028784_30130 [Myceligenerans cantabricum]